ncbi:MAG: DUF3800 domain-containing protein [Bacillota bacterium]|nr:DUF3800 domain-containing protein [Bacillota bacterium]
MSIEADWRSRPTCLDMFREDIDYVMFVDENGHVGALANILECLRLGKAINRCDAQFTVTGCVLAREHFPEIRSRILDLKATFWPPDGLYNHRGKPRRVCFISRKIRRADPPFDLDNREDFLKQLSNFMATAPYKVFSASINLELHATIYYIPQDPYSLCMDFIFERFGKFFLKPKKASGVVVLEARGENEDLKLLKHCVRILERGTRYVTPKELSCIKGVYFNPKWDKNSERKKSYFGLELADLLSYPIHQHVRDGLVTEPFRIIKPHFYSYPNYRGRGLKIFP